MPQVPGHSAVIDDGTGAGDRMEEERQLSAWESARIDDFMALAAAALVVVVVVLRGYAATGAGSLVASVLVLAALAYAVSIARREWPLLLAGVGFVLAAACGWAVAQFVGQPWTVSDPMALVLLLAVWMPWPTLRSHLALGVMWVLALAPLLMLLVGPPVGNLGWVSAVVTQERVEWITGANEVGIPAGLAVLAALALRLDRDTWPRYLALWSALVLVGISGTRVVLPGVVVAGALWIGGRRGHGRWRGMLTELLPWLVYVGLSVQPALMRTVDRLDAGLDEASSGRLYILSEYWVHAREALWGGRGVGATEALRTTDRVDVGELPHNGVLTLVIDVGIPGMLVATVGMVAFVLYRSWQVDGPGRWVLRVPLLVLLPSLYLLDHGLFKPFLTVPIMLFAAAAPWIGESSTTRSGPSDGSELLGASQARP